MKKQLVAISSLLVVLLLTPLLVSIAFAQSPSVQPAKFVEDELLIQFVAGVSDGSVRDTLSRHGAKEVGEISAIRVKRIKVPPQALDRVKEALAKNPHVRFVEPNYIADPSVNPNDPSFVSQWHLSNISAPQGWDISTGLVSVDIGIADSGVDPTHPDLGSKLLPGFNFFDNNTDTHDVFGHGTMVAGTAAAIGNNGVGGSGVAWTNDIVPLRVTDTSGYAYYSTMANAITYCADHGIRVINLSFGASSNSSTLQAAVDYAWKKGTIVFASAGNSGSSNPTYPAACNNAVAVSATTSSDTRASFSNFGSWITVAAPGSGIYTTTRGGGYASVSGTSFSSPITAGIGALILSVNQSLSAQQVVDILKQSADDLGTPGFDQDFGYGRVNVQKALAAAQVAVAQPDTTAPAVSISSPTGHISGSGNISIITSASDNVGVVKVELLVNGNVVATDSTNPVSFLWDSTTVPDGTYDVQARAYDAAGNSAVSGIVTIDVRNSLDTTPPSVSIISPIQATVTGLRKVTISASATDNVSVSKIDLYVDGLFQATATGSSISWTWNLRGVASGAHVIQAVARDGAGNTATASYTLVR